MKRPIAKIAQELKLFWKNYLLQTLLATLVIFIVILFLKIQQQAVIVASIGSTAFIVFAMPKAVTAQARNVIGGHLLGIACGSLCLLIPHQSSLLVSAMVYSFAVGLSIFLMVILDAEHPPASGTALGVAITGFSWNVAIALIASALVLSLVHHVAKAHLKDLT